MDSFLFTFAAFILALSILITVHEFGHFWVARKLEVKVLRFSLGFGQPLWKRRSRNGETEFVVAAIPLGGYVKMLDEREAPVDPTELHRAFNRKPLGVRSAIVIAGPLFNFLFAIAAFWIVFMSGDVGMRPILGQVAQDSRAAQAGFAPGDEITFVGDQEVLTWEQAIYALLSESMDKRALGVQVRMPDGDKRLYWLNVEGIQNLADDGKLLENLGITPLRPQLPPVIGQLVPGEAAEAAGLSAGDLILKVNGQPMKTWKDWVEFVQSHPGQLLDLEIERDGEIMALAITPREKQSEGQTIGFIGASVETPTDLLAQYRREVRYGPLDALGVAVRKTGDFSYLMLKVLGKMLVGEVSVKNLSGPISIADYAGKSASVGPIYFLKFLAVVSISLGVLNLLPIPVLDGGHLFFYMIEAIKGRPLSDHIIEQGQRVGMLLLFIIMGIALFVDLNRFLG